MLQGKFAKWAKATKKVTRRAMHKQQKPETGFESADNRPVLTIHTSLRGFGEYNKRNVLFILEPQDDFFSIIPPSLVAKYEF